MRVNLDALRALPEWQEGRDAASKREHFNTHCPYTFDRTGVDQRTFNREYRARMDAWFHGWKSWLDERGVGLNFASIKAQHRRLTP